MKLLVNILLSFLLFTSCATLLNHRTQKINISGDKKIKNIRLDTSNKPAKEGNTYFASRNKKPLIVHFELDSVTKTIYFKPRNSFAFWSNVYLNLGIGMLVDKKNEKRYGYRKNIYIDRVDSLIEVNYFAPSHKGDVNISFALPYVNAFNIQTNNGYHSSNGFFGLEAGVDYYYKDKHFLSLNAGGGIDFPIPVIAPYDRIGEYQTSGNSYINLRNHNAFGKLDVGYGINYSQSVWRLYNRVDSVIVPEQKITATLGLSFSLRYRLGQRFRIGLLHQPNLVAINTSPTFFYRHFTSLEFIWNVNIWRRRGN